MQRQKTVGFDELKHLEGNKKFLNKQNPGIFFSYRRSPGKYLLNLFNYKYSAYALIVCLHLICGETFATDLIFEGNVRYQINADRATVVLSADRIRNITSGGISGTIRIELWAFSSPYTGGSELGYRLATHRLMDTLLGGFSYINISSGTINYSDPPDGIWYLSLLLTEFTESPVNDGFSLQDFVNFSNTIVVGDAGSNGSETQFNIIVLTGMGVVAGENIQHPNGNIFDQVLLTGQSVKLRAKEGQITRVSFLDENEDIVQVEFSGSGTVTVNLDPDTYSGLALPIRYNQEVQYVKGRASIFVENADESTFISIFTVGRINAVNQELFPEGEVYDAVADVSLLEISGTSIGGILTANTFYSADEGLTGIDAANVEVRFRAVVGDIDAKGSAVPVLRFGQGSTFEQDGGALIVAGGDLIQTNGAAILVSLSETKTGFNSIRSQDGVKSDGTKFFAKLIQTPLVNTAGQLINVPGTNQLGQGGEVNITQIAPIIIQLITGASYNIPLAIVTGGNPPYTVFLDSGVGFQPMGMNLHIEDDGTIFLIGTPSEGSESPFSRQFGLCVKDLGGNSDCLIPPFSYFVERSSLTGTWTGTWTRPVSGFCEETSSLTWNLNQSGTTVSGTFFKVVTAVEGFCPDQVGTQTSGMLINGNFEGANIIIMTDGGTLFEGSFTDDTIEGSGGGSLGKGPFKLQRQP